MRQWFRKSSWSEADRLDFETRFARTRHYSRAQYLRLQAFHLAEAGLHADAILLIDRLLADYPDSSEIASAYLQRAVSCDALDRVGEALASFRAAVVAERTRRTIRTNVSFTFPLFVATRRLQSEFDEALAILNEAEAHVMFPRHRFDVAATRALIADHLGDARAAQTAARQALAAAAEGHSGFVRHPNVGLVPNDNPLIAELRRMAG
jgi:hypothetical protein